MRTARGISRTLRIALAIVLTLAMLPLPIFHTPTAEAWSTASGYVQDENALRTAGAGGGDPGYLQIASTTNTTARRFTASYATGTAPMAGQQSGITDVYVSQISQAWVMFRDVGTGKWAYAYVRKPVTGTNWYAAGEGFVGVYSFVGTSDKGAGDTNTESRRGCESVAQTFTNNPNLDVIGTLGATCAGGEALLGREGASQQNIKNVYGGNHILSATKQVSEVGAEGAFIQALTLFRLDDGANGSDAGFGDKVLRVQWEVAFAVPQTRGPIELWLGVEAANIEGRKLYDGWDRFLARSVGRVPQVGISSIPSGAVVGQTASLVVEGKDPEDLSNGHEDIRAVKVTLVDRQGDWVTLMLVHRRADSTSPSLTDKNDGIQIVSSSGRYNPLREPTTSEVLSHPWLTLDLATTVEDGDNLRVTFPVTFREAARGKTFTVYAEVVDREYNSSGLVRVGTIAVQ